MLANSADCRLNSAVWVPKDIVVAATKSTRIRAWANTFTKWVPGSVQRRRQHETHYRVYFRTSSRFGCISLDIPAEAITIDIRQARKLFKAGPSISLYDQVWEIVRQSPADTHEKPCQGAVPPSFPA